jgi:5-methylcytosine-specific restriction enzyme subunit McrC
METYILKQVQKACNGTHMVVSGQESKSFWSSNSLRPDVVLRQGDKTYVIDTKWKRPQKNSASIGDLRQMYAYCRFWDAERALLLYPRQANENKFRSHLTDDYSKDTEDDPNPIDHQ